MLLLIKHITFNIMKREGKELSELEQQARTANKLIFWGIQKFFDLKQCYKYFKKNFGEHAEATHLCKQKNKPFFIIKFSSPINCDDFNQQFAKNKRIKAKIMQDNTELINGINEESYIEVENIMKNAEKVVKEVTEQQLNIVRNTKIEDVVASLHSMPYGEQVEFKIAELNKVIENYNTQFFRDNEVKRLIYEEKKNVGQLLLSQFIACEKRREGYRSKSQFTIGTSETGEPIVGFNKGSYVNNTIMVESPENVPIISDNTKKIVILMRDFIKRTIGEQSEYQEFVPFHRIKQEGFWRYLVVRQSERMSQTLILVVAKTEGFQAEKVSKLKGELIEYLRTTVDGLKSLCFLSYNGEADSIPSQKPEVLWGTPYYNEKIFDKVYQVSPSAFLQIHMDMCEVLYDQIIKAVKECDLVLDLGCGIGTIGISIMNKLPDVKVIGVEICEEAVEDARKNDENYEVYLGRAEQHVKSICEANKGKKIVAILDPPRPGFHKDVLVALRRCRGLDNIIYVACNAKAIQDNLLQLTLPVTNRRKAPQFIIKRMIGLDLFPQTPHYEALYILERTEY